MPEAVGIINKATTTITSGSSLFERIQYILGFLMIIIFLSIGVSDSFKEKSIYPIIEQTGGRIVSADYFAGKWVDDLQNNLNAFANPEYKETKECKVTCNVENFITWLKMIWGRFTVFLMLFFNFYFVYFIFFMLFKICCWLGDGGIESRAMIYSISTIALLQIFFKVGLLFNFEDPLKSIFFGVGILAITTTILIIHANEVSKQTLKKGVFLMILIITLSVSGIFMQKFEATKEIGTAIVPFTGTAKLITFAWNLVFNNEKIQQFILSANYFPEPNQSLS